MDSPLARALMKKALDDEVKVEVPGGHDDFTSMWYEDRSRRETPS